MPITSFENLDISCAKAGMKIAQQPSKEREHRLLQALSVLEDQGVYALFLFLRYHKNNKINHEIFSELETFMQRTPQHEPLLDKRQEEDPFKCLQMLGNNLDDLLLAHTLLRQALIYARYHAKAYENNEQE